MRIDNILPIYFSPVFHTKGLVQLLSGMLAQNLACALLDDLDITKPGDYARELGASQLAIIGVPVYGGRTPRLAVERLRSLRGNGAPAILLASYGNRAFEDALIELQDQAAACGFIPLAAAACIAEHTIAPTIAAGRPDNADVESLKKFADALGPLLASQNGQNASLSLPGNHPYKDYQSRPLPQQVDDNCVKCGICARECPATAISQDNPAQVSDQCICCMRCISICPQHARKPSPELIEAITQKLSACCASPRANEYFFAGSK